VIPTLIVDDDYRVAELHALYLDHVDGFRLAGIAHSGTEALEMVDTLRPELVLLDFYLPDIGGLEVIRRLRHEDHPRVDVIAVTAARDADSLREAIRGGVVHYLIKPFRRSAFEEKLTSYASARARLDRIADADQSMVDRVFGTLRAPGAAHGLPKQLSDATLDLIVASLSRAETGLGAAEVAELAGVSRVTARRYLEHLCRVGRAELTMRYGSPGRPEHRYRLAPASSHSEALGEARQGLNGQGRR
jgi:response regulator of citrate/malate metabolism